MTPLPKRPSLVRQELLPPSPLPLGLRNTHLRAGGARRTYRSRRVCTSLEGDRHPTLERALHLPARNRVEGHS